MKGKQSKIRKRLCHSGYEEPVYDKFKKEIMLQNRLLVETTSFIGSVIMVLLTVVAIFVPSVSKVLPLYATIAGLFLLIYFLIRGDKPKSEIVVIVCNYAFLTVAFLFAFGLDVIQKNPTATTICVLLVALPLLIIDRPYREGIYFIIMSICFMIETVFIKQSPKASVDVLNSISFLIIGLFLGYKHNQMMLRNIVGHSLLEEQRDMDSLTTLLNKGALEKRAICFLEKEGATASIIVIDMDNFKFVNDTYGHHAGDEILIKLGELLKSLFRKEDFIGRFGGDEFVVFVPGNENKNLIVKRADEILDGVREIRIGADADYRAQVCMGIAIYPVDGGNYEELFQHADAAMYMVKKNGKNGYGLYDTNMKEKILIVDDIEMNRSVLKKTLEKEYDILEATDGVNALHILEKNKNIAMVITDIQMPHMDGIELIKKIRSSDEFRNIAVIANTQYGDLKQEEQMFKLGVDDFVYKAASPRIIQIRVKNVMRAKNT